MRGDTIVKARIALGGVAHKPWRNKDAEAFLEGQKASKEIFSKAASVVLDGAQAFKFNAFKIKLAERAIVRSALDATKA
jgi:xanthine dehydrogenase YagS FAD-binding subunit